MARYSLVVLKVPLNINQTNQHNQHSAHVHIQPEELLYDAEHDLLAIARYLVLLIVIFHHVASASCTCTSVENTQSRHKDV